MTKIKFNCPNCSTKLKVPANLAGVAGPCPKCGATIVAPLQSDEEHEPQKVERKSAVVSGGSVIQEQVTAPPVIQQAVMVAQSVPMQSPPPVVVPPIIHQPVVQAVAAPRVNVPPIIQKPVVQTTPSPGIQQPAHQPTPQFFQPQPSPLISNQVGFPRPFEQVSHTAAVALTNPGRNYPAAPPDPTPNFYQPQTPSRPQSQAGVIHSFHSKSLPPQPVEPADLIPQDVFQEYPNSNQAISDSFIPQTQPIVVKKRQEASFAQGPDKNQPMPRLDASLGRTGGGGALQAGQPVGVSPTVINLPEVGSASNNFAINPPTKRPEYRPPTPVALTPPVQVEVEDDTARAESASYHVEPEFPIAGFTEDQGDQSYQGHYDPQYPVEEYSQPVEEYSYPGEEYNQNQVGEHYQQQSENAEYYEPSVAAFLAEAMESREKGSAKTKEEILDELLGVSPTKKKGLSASMKFMLASLAAVAVVCVTIMYFAIEKLGGLNMSSLVPQGNNKTEVKEGISTTQIINGNINQKSDSKSSDSANLPQIPDIGVERPPVEIKIEDVVEELKGNGAVELGVTRPDYGKESNIDEVILSAPNRDPQPQNKAPEISQPKVEERPVPDIVVTKTPTSLPSVPKPDYNPPAFFPRPGPDDNPLKNTHELADAFLRAPNWQRRIPYIYNGEAKASQIASYHKEWPDVAYGDFKMVYVQSEMEEEYGGPFWVYKITVRDSEVPLDVPMVIRVENGNLKVDWEAFVEFRDQHYVKYIQGEIEGAQTFRVVAERISEYPGPDRPGFTDMNQYLCYEINAPYGGYKAFAKYAFVKKGTPAATKIDKVSPLGEEPVALIIGFDLKPFSHGVRHMVITDLIDEGWFR